MPDFSESGAARLPITRRIDLNLGYSCNQRCRFCYYQVSMDARKKDRDITAEEAKTRIRSFRRWGMEVVEFTGGEPTIRNDLPELARFALETGFQAVSIITNGLRLSDEAYSRELQAAGVSDFLFSVHAANPEVHDDLTRTKDSFRRTMQAIRNALELGCKVRSNTVVTAANLGEIEALADLLSDMGVQTVNLILFNPIAEAHCTEPGAWIEYSKAAPVIERVLLAHADDSSRLNVRYIPFCLLPGWESHVTNVAQIQYDPDEWDYYVRTRFREGLVAWAAALVAGCVLLPSYRRALSAGWYVTKHEAVKKLLEVKNKKHGPACRRCSYRFVCDGLWRAYAKRYGFGELRAVDGPLLLDPDVFMRRRGTD